MRLILKLGDIRAITSNISQNGFTLDPKVIAAEAEELPEASHVFLQAVEQ